MREELVSLKICSLQHQDLQIEANALSTGTSSLKDQIPSKTSTKHTSRNRGSRTVPTALSEYVQASPSSDIRNGHFPSPLLPGCESAAGLEPPHLQHRGRCRHHSGNASIFCRKPGERQSAVEFAVIPSLSPACIIPCDLAVGYLMQGFLLWAAERRQVPRGRGDWELCGMSQGCWCPGLVSRARSKERGRSRSKANAAGSLQHPACGCPGSAALVFPLDSCSWGIPVSQPLFHPVPSRSYPTTLPAPGEG